MHRKAMINSYVLWSVNACGTGTFGIAQVLQNFCNCFSECKVSYIYPPLICDLIKELDKSWWGIACSEASQVPEVFPWQATNINCDYWGWIAHVCHVSLQKSWFKTILVTESRIYHLVVRQKLSVFLNYISLTSLEHSLLPNCHNLIQDFSMEWEFCFYMCGQEICAKQMLTTSVHFQF